MSPRRTLLVAAGLVVAVATTYLVVRDGGSATDVVIADATTTTVALPPSTTTSSATSTPATTEPTPAYQHSIDTVTLEQLGSSWRPDLGCAAPEQLRGVNVSYWGYDGAVHLGRVIVDAAHAERVVAIFGDIYAARFPIQQMVPIDAYGGDDEASMRANNTSGFNCRQVAGTTRLSEHAFGRAIDVNPLVNPYVRGGTVDPPEGAPYADRSRTDLGMIHADDVVVRAFARQGWGWGGSWSGGRDYQHFSSTGR
jgi:hypothetical protein